MAAHQNMVDDPISKCSIQDEAFENLCLHDHQGHDIASKIEFSGYCYRKQKATVEVCLLSFFAAIGGFLIGYNTGVVSGALLLLKDRFSLSSIRQELVVSITIGGGFAASLFGGILSDWFGRRLVILTSSCIFTAGAIVLGVADDFTMLVAGRFIVGLGIGLTALAVPVYIAESTPVHLRGRFVTAYTLFVTGGQCVAGLVNGAFSYLEKDGWRFMFGLACVPPIVQFFGLLFLPESPRWLMRKGRLQQAKMVLEKLRGTPYVDQELSEIRETLDDHRNIANNIRKNRLTILRILRTPHTRRALIVGCALQFFQQFGGINVIMYYSASIIKMAGVTDRRDAIWLAALVAAVNFLFTIVGIGLVERSGRRKLVIASLLGAGPSLGICATAFQLASVYSPTIPSSNRDLNSSCGSYLSCGSCVEDTSCGFCYTGKVGNVSGTCLLTRPEKSIRSDIGACANTSVYDEGVKWAYNYCPTDYSWLAIVGMVIYLMFFAPGMGPMPWTINAEIYPLWARSTGNAFSSTAHWLSNLFVSMSFLTMTEILTKHGTFWLFVGICAVGAVFFIIFLPETRGKKLEEVEQLFEKPWCSFLSSHSDVNNDMLRRHMQEQKISLEREQNLENSDKRS